MGRGTHKLLLAIERGDGAGFSQIASVAEHGTGLYIVQQLGAENPFQLGFYLWVVDRTGDLNSAQQISGHQVRRRDEVLGLFSPTKAVDAGVLQIAAHNAGDVEALCFSGNSRPYAADAPENQLDLYACLAGLLKLVDDGSLREGVCFDADISLMSQDNLFIHVV